MIRAFFLLGLLLLALSLFVTISNNLKSICLCVISVFYSILKCIFVEIPKLIYKKCFKKIGIFFKNIFVACRLICKRCFKKV